MGLPLRADDPREDGWPAYDGAEVRYARWDGRQRLPDLTADEVLGALADDLVEESDVEDALMRLLRRGMAAGEDPRSAALPGLDALRQRLARARREALSRYQLDDVLGDIREELAAIVAAERRGIERRMAGGAFEDTDGDPAREELEVLAADLAARRQERLDALPTDIGERIRALRDYDFLEPDARQRFEALLDRLGGRMLDAVFEGMADAIRDATPEQLAANREMVRDLDALLQRRLAGDEPAQAEVDDFLARHGGFFPGARTLDDIVASLEERMATMQSLMRSLSAEQRDELASMMDALLRDDRLRWDLAQLASTLDQLLPGGLGGRMRFRGQEPLGLEGALGQLDRLGRLERLADRIDGLDSPGDLGDLADEEVRDLLGDEAADQLAALRDLARRLEEAGYVSRDGEQLTLTPRGARRLGQQVLDQLFARLSRDAFGEHDVRRTGGAGERAETSSPWQFGRPFDLDLRATLASALADPRNAPAVSAARVAAGGRRVLLSPGDFVVSDADVRSDAATVLLLDMSRSMLLRDCALAAKKVALALQALIRSRFPRDQLHIVSFAYSAREIPADALATLSWDAWEYGTNLQHGLQVARGLLARSRSANRSVLVITDGEPTAHIEDGQVEFAYPPTRRTIRETLREVVRCTRDGIVINTFMLDRSPALAAFVEHVTRLNRGRAFHADPEDLGRYVLVDYVGRRSAR
ncbi:MAG: VWA domain-containing protein [Chloroflexi bacterium]|nr:VWA domain-containing protein [Chloroflexota bacterium]